jgi:hypothetical protein
VLNTEGFGRALGDCLFHLGSPDFWYILDQYVPLTVVADEEHIFGDELAHATPAALSKVYVHLHDWLLSLLSSFGLHWLHLGSDWLSRCGHRATRSRAARG